MSVIFCHIFFFIPIDRLHSYEPIRTLSWGFSTSQTPFIPLFPPSPIIHSALTNLCKVRPSPFNLLTIVKENLKSCQLLMQFVYYFFIMKLILFLSRKPLCRPILNHKTNYAIHLLIHCSMLSKNNKNSNFTLCLAIFWS